MTNEEFLERLNAPPAPMILESRDAYFRDQAELLAHRSAHPDEKWVAYHGSERIGFGVSQPKLFKECLARGLSREQFLVMGIDAAMAKEMETSL